MTLVGALPYCLLALCLWVLIGIFHVRIWNFLENVCKYVEGKVNPKFDIFLMIVFWPLVAVGLLLFFLMSAIAVILYGSEDSSW